MPDTMTLFRRPTQQPMQDEWYIPYQKPQNSSVPPPSALSSIGKSPAPVRQNSSNLLSYFSSPTSPVPTSSDIKTFRFPKIQQSPVEMERTVFKSPSHSSLIDIQLPGRIPTTNSVPTGLSEPKLLFSPLSREVRGTSYQPSSPHSTPPRSRTVSAPAHRHRAQNPYERTMQPRQWAAPTVCDRLVLARPSITPHVITPPASPDDRESDALSRLGEKVMEDAKTREKEREGWADYVRRRGRSLSFGSQRPTSNAPIIGNAKVRAEEHERRMSVTRRRSNSLGARWRDRNDSTNASRPGLQHAKSDDSVGVSKSFGFLRRGSVSKPKPRSGDQSPMFGDFDSSTLPQTPNNRYTRGHSYTRSSPELLQPAYRRPAPGPPPRTLRIQQPPTISRDGVVIIGPAPSNYLPDDSFHRPPPTMEQLSKPLPALPAQLTSPKLDVGPFDSLSTEIGKAISPQLQDTQFLPSPLPTSVSAPERIQTPSNARAYLAKQHQIARTRKAFQTPVAGPTAYRHKYSETPTPLNTSTSATSSFAAQATGGARRKTALEEAIGRSRAASVSTLDTQKTPRSVPMARPRTADSDDTPTLKRLGSISPAYSTQHPPIVRPHPTSPVSPTFVPSPQLAYPITTTVPSLLSVPPMDRADSNMSKASKTTQYTDASEGWDRSALPTPDREDSPGDTPSPEREMDDRDFQGLFFRTPQDLGASFSMPSRGPPPTHIFPSATRDPDTPTGLGFNLDAPRMIPSEPRRPSDASGETSEGTETLEIATPVIFSDDQRFGGEYIDFSHPMSGRGGQQERRESRPARLTRGYDVPGNDESSGENRAAARITLSNQSSEEFRLSAAPVRRPTLIATPPRRANSGDRRSIVPETHSGDDESPGRMSLSSLQSRIYSHPSPDRTALSPGTFGAQTLVFDAPNPLDSPDPQFSPGSNYSPPRRPSNATSNRYSAVPSFVHDFPSPPDNISENEMDYDEPTAPTTATEMLNEEDKSHSMAFGQVVTGPPGAGKTTYCHGMHQFLTALGRPVHVINLDPAVPNPPYPCAINITELITLDSVMEEYHLGPNGAMLYVAEYLEENIDWLIERLDEVLGAEEDGSYVIFDTPGQVELWTNHESFRRVIERLTKLDYRLVAVHLSDAHYITDASKFISVALLALRAMMQMELPHINVLSKIDLLSTYGELPFDLRYYAECRDLDYLLDRLDSEPGAGKAKMRALNRAMVELIDEYGMVGFETLAVEDKRSMLRLLRVLDKANGYVHLPDIALPEDEDDHEHDHDQGDMLSRMPELEDLGDVDDVQERWGPKKAEYDELEQEEWGREWETRAMQSKGFAANVIRPEEGAVERDA